MKRMVQLTSAGILTAGAAAAWRSIRRSLEPVRYTFRGKVVVITGGSRGLGLVLARQLAEEGASVALLARSGDDLRTAAKDIARRGADVLALPCDVRSKEQVQAAIGRVIEKCKRIDVLINNAGVIQGGPVEHMELDDYEEAMGVHFWGTLHPTRAVVPHMRRQGGGRIVNISSIGGLVSIPHLVPYSASKFAVSGLSTGLRYELSKDHIIVTTVCPGLMRTGSHYNAVVKGRHRKEFTVFALISSLPIFSIDDRLAARQIIEACRNGKPLLIITWQAWLLYLANSLFPNTTARLMSLSVRFLPRPTGDEGDAGKLGWEIESRFVPSILTQLNDIAAIRNNQLQGHRPMVSAATVERSEQAQRGTSHAPAQTNAPRATGRVAQSGGAISLVNRVLRR